MVSWRFIVMSFVDSYHFARADAERSGAVFLDQGYSTAFTIEWSKLVDPKSGYLDANGRLTFRIALELVYERTRPPLTSHNSKKVTGMVGLENLGATCYLNALLQVLYCLLVV